MLFLIARLFARHAFVWPNLVSAAAAVFGLTGAATFPTLATTQSELVPGLAILIALARWLVLEDERRNTVSSALVTGGLAGVSVGLKLTEAPLFVGMAVAIALRFATGKRSALLEAFAFGLGGLIVFAALDGAWLWGNAKAYGNPIFPYMNNLFHSDLIALGSWTDGRFIPKTRSWRCFIRPIGRSTVQPTSANCRCATRASCSAARAPSSSSSLSRVDGCASGPRPDRQLRLRSRSFWGSRSLSPTRCGRRSGPSIAISRFKRV